MPQFFQRFRRRPKNQDATSTDLPLILSKTGIDYDTCNSNASLRDYRDYTAMPLPPPRRPLTPPPESADPEESPGAVNTQTQSALFARLPRNIRERIYIELFGERAVHVEYDYGFAPGYRGREKKPPDQWRWWHRVCEEEEAKPGDMCRSDDLDDLKRKGKRELLKYKLKGVEWLRTCRIGYQEALPILYGTNTFLIASAVKLCRFPKVIVPSHLTAITSLDILHIAKATTPSTMSDDDWSMYNTIFRTLRLSYTGLQRLRLVVYILNKPCTPRAGSVSEEFEEAWFRPWQDLALSRTWEKLEIGIQASWFKDFSEGAERWAKKVGREEPGYTLVQVEDYTTWDGKLSEVWNAPYL